MNNNKVRNKDKLFGSMKEKAIKKIIDDTFNCQVAKLSPFHAFDYLDSVTNTYYEFKGRRNNFTKYPETMIGYNKIQFIHKNPNNIYYLIFGYNDGNYYIKYDEELFKTFRVDIGGRNDRSKDEYKNYLYIPINHLTKMSNVNVDPGLMLVETAVSDQTHQS
jgi:hypothetical protein